MNELFDDVLRHPNPGFHLGARLAAHYPDRGMLEGDARYLAARNYAAAGHATMALVAERYSQLDTTWDAVRGIQRTSRVAWWSIVWDGSEFELAIVKWPREMHGDHERFCLLGPSKARCEALFDAVNRWNHEVRGEILVFANGCFQKDDRMHAAIAGASFDQLVLNGDLKTKLRADFTQFLASRARYEAAGVPWKRGAVLHGPPGNGKTLCVKALVNELAIPCLYVQSFQPRQYQTAHECIATVFKRARETTPCVLVLEDIDSLLNDQTRSLFLNELDGFAANAGIITLATTNHLERLDPAIVDRPSRFDRKYHFDLPDADARRRYIGLRNGKLADALRLDEAACTEIAAVTAGFTFAYLQELFVSAMMRFASAEASAFLPVMLALADELRGQLARGAAGRVEVPAIADEPDDDDEE